MFVSRFFIICICLFAAVLVHAQSVDDQYRQVEQRLNALTYSVPGLQEKVKLSVSGASLQEFVRALAESNGLNINIDPNINHQIVNNFQGETALNVLLFLSKTYQLDINVIGSILSISAMRNAAPVIPKREIKASYNAADNTLSYELNNDTLASVARKIGEVSGRNVVVPVSLQGKTVSGYMTASPFDVALEKLAYANSLRYHQTTDGVYVFESLVPGEELFINDSQETAVRYRGNSTQGMGGQQPGMGGMQQGGGNFTVYKQGNSGPQGKLFTIQATRSSLIDLIKRAAEDAGINYFIYSDIQGQVSTSVKDITFDSFLSSIFQGTPYTYRIENGTYLIGDRKVEGLRSSKIIHVKNRSIDTLIAMIPMDWKRDVEIKEFKEQNMLLLSGSGPQIDEIEMLINKLDRLVPMVLIEVTLLDIRKGTTVETGISAGVSDSLRTGGTLLSGMDFTFGAGSINRFLSQIGSNNSFNLGRVAPSFYVTLKALEANENVEMRSVPKLSTLNGHEASLSIGSKRYYRTETQNVIPSLQSQNIITEQFTEVEANLQIDIRPVVSADDQITLNIKVDITDFIGTPAENRPPPTSTSKFESIIRARNEDMIVLGGIERLENSDSGSGIPILSRIPVLRWIFSSKKKTTSKVVSVVFIKPTIIY
ncbi:secretin and TonB N-terminal domain-containing protein [Sphingobacterium olei]|uniref:secretin and TonB N-terminal domain-containing protein n=1 Tax=Sphingobacterium olei TaxID=2571155 RepID=UPI001EE4B07E|nr:secretin and TonB N-terminal domain-containing protein [Sphingobacterium olei]